MIPEDQQEIYMLAKEHPSLFQSHCFRLKGYFEGRAVIIIANPRSGSTLLMRLLMHACLTHCLGDRMPQVYSGLASMYSGFFSKHYQYRDALLEENFPDMYCGYDCEKHQMIAWQRIASDTLFGRMFGGHCKMTMLGWGNRDVESFVNMVRHTFEGNLTIVWLTRPAEEVVNSLLTREGGKLYGRQDLKPQLIEQCEEQTLQFRSAWELEDVRFTYEQLITDTAKCLKKCQPYYSVNKPVMEKILANKIR